FKTCVSKADSLGVFSAGTLGCRRRAESVQLPLPSTRSTGTVSEKLLRIVDERPDAAAFESLGLALLSAGKTSLAQLTLTRAAELGGAPTNAQNGLGMASLMLGDAMGARAAYEKALEGPGREKAHINLAALRCRFGDKEGARRELSQVRNPSSLNGPE